MAVDRRKGGSNLQTPSERATADRISRARTDKRPRGVEYYVRASELAQQLGVDAGDVMDEFDERAGCREYDAGMTRAEAERLAWNDVVERLTKQGKLAV